MKKIASLFKRDYDGSRLVYDEVVPGSEWVIEGEGIATQKWDGTSCLVYEDALYKRYDRRLSKSKARQMKRDKSYIPQIADYKSAPEGWIAAEPEPNRHTSPYRALAGLVACGRRTRRPMTS